jgi:RNA polymerase sigma factor (sigma-70 family)
MAPSPPGSIKHLLQGADFHPPLLDHDCNLSFNFSAFAIQYFSPESVFNGEMEMALQWEIGRTYQKEKKRLLAFIRSRVEKLEDAEDILQDVFYHTLEGLSVTDRIDNLMGWLYVAARNKVIDWYRKKRLPTYSLEEMEKYSIEALIDDCGLHPEKAYDQKMIAEALAEGVEALPEEQRMVFIWQEVEGMTFKEIAEMTGEPINTLISRKRYALQHLRRQLQEIKSIMDEKS